MAVDMMAVWLSIAVVVALILVWKFVKFAFKIALIVGVAILLWLGARSMEWI